MGHSFSWKTRRDLLARAQAPSKIYDLCIVGGGITGAAIARDAALRGLSVILVEKDDFASGTSSRSSKLVHGGVRYLEQYEFGLVMESTRERAVLWKTAPHLVTPLPFLFPAFKTSRRPLWMLSAGLWLYDLLAMFRTPTLHRTYGRERTMREEPLLRSSDLTGSIFYWDGATDDALLTLSNIVDAHALGAHCLSRVSLQQVESRPGSDGGEQTLRLKDTLSGTEFTARARALVVATGPWTDASLKLGNVRFPRILKTSRGSHVVVPAAKCAVKHAIVMFHPVDGRVLFAIPWGDATVLGTTDLFDERPPEKVAIDADEVDYLLKSAMDYFPSVKLVPADVLSTWSGLRPLVAPDSDGSASSLSREHHLEWRDEGIVVIAGGKLTTNREMAEQAVDKLFEGSASWRKPLSRGFVRSKTAARPLPPLRHAACAQEEALGLSEAGRFNEVQLREICRFQMVLTLEDLLVRRTSLFYKEPRNGLDLLPRLERVLAEELDWDAAEWQRQVAAYRAFVQLHVATPLKRPL
jgi:glycerol-3-phosphate dehydrogenase